MTSLHKMLTWVVCVAMIVTLGIVYVVSEHDQEMARLDHKIKHTNWSPSGYVTPDGLWIVR